MRNLTIHREKTFVASLAKLNVYIVDDLGDTTINNQRCRKLGTLKNGEEKTFTVDDWATRIYVIADKLSTGFCSELYDLPAGIEDVRLTGKCKYNPVTGNAFRFNGLPGAAAQEHRSRTGKKGCVVQIVAILIGLIVGLTVGFFAVKGLVSGLLKAKPKEFRTEELTITLNTDFEPWDEADFDACYFSGEVMVMIIKEPFEGLKEAELEVNSLKEYGELLMNLYEIDGDITEEDGLTYFEYDYSDMVEGDYHYVVTVHEGADAYWIVEFSVEQKNAEDYADQIKEWAKSVKVTGKTGPSGAV